ncbi:hypothetical protein [Thermococcus zilligii]|uniref:hypothetical protein n=1 Tax=Thermococcus zilligii TaxID=54076 RepID=UPI00029AA89B|nr:hypothetical protein [Thermococcus zilligii]
MDAYMIDAAVGVLVVIYSLVVGIIGAKAKNPTKQMWAAMALFFGALIFGLWTEYRR